MAAADSNEGEELTNTLHVKRKPCKTTLSNGVLSWCRCTEAVPNKGHTNHCHSIKLNRVIAIVPHSSETFATIPNDIELKSRQPQNNYRSFHLHVIVKKHSHKWQLKKVLFDCGNTAVGSIWITRIKTELHALDRPRNLLIFVNPHGGKKQAPRIFKNKVLPLLELTSVRIEVVQTTHADHARDYILNEPHLEQYDGIISVGGDGMFSEILNGILIRNKQNSADDIEPQKPNVKLGIIPAGSTDCVCYCTTGTIDPTTSTLQIVAGETLAIDISSIRNNDRVLKYSVSFAGYGFFGDVLKDSEKLRWVGVQRYDISGAKTFLANRYYEGELSYLISADAQGHPQDRSKCRAGCRICSPSQSMTFGELVPAEATGWHSTSGRFISVIGATNCCANMKSPEGMSPSAHLADGFIDLVVVRQTSRVQYLRHMIRLAGRADHFDFSFVEVHRVKEFSFRPLPCGSKERDECDDGPGVVEDHVELSEKGAQESCTRVRRRRESHDGKYGKSVWNVDGEIIDEPSIHVRVHRQLVTLFAHGIEDCEKSTTCSVCRRR